MGTGCSTTYVREKWRDHGYEYWNYKAVSKIRGEIHKIFKSLHAEDKIKIVICGDTGEGKSSLINNLIAAVNGFFILLAQYDSKHNQVTKWYKEHNTTREECGHMRNLPLIFAETRGFSVSMMPGALVAAIQNCILGQVANEEEIDEEWQARDHKTTKASFIFCVADVRRVPANDDKKANESWKTLRKNLKDIRNFCFKEDIGMAAFLTNCDRLDTRVRYDVSNLYISREVQRRVEMFSKKIGLPPYRTYPIVNYWNETNVTNKMAMQALIPLKECLLETRSKIFS